jgi:hypothetical protein
MNNQTGNGLVINNNQINEEDKNLYIQQITLLKEENAYLKTVINGLLK